MNVRDSEIILGMIKQRGYVPVTSPGDADVILFNTCSVRQHAEERVWGQVSRLRELKEESRKDFIPDTRYEIRDTKTIGIVGCMAQNYKQEIFRRSADVNFVCGPANIYDIPDLLEKVGKENVQVLAVDRLSRPLYSDGCALHQDSTKAFVSIMYGCNNFCSYCIVPFVRGRERSRPLKHILDEVRDLAVRGCQEITLLGQNVNSYGKGSKNKINFVGLLKRLNKVKGLERIRFVTSHPKDASASLFRAMSDLPKVCKDLHLPLQSGSDKILRLMNRKYTFAEYLKKINCLRSLIPDCQISTDIIVGFPGEREVDFRQTKIAMQKIRFDRAFIFKYSPRAKTRAAKFKDDVPFKVKQARNQILLKLQKEISWQKKNRRKQCLR